VNKLQQRLADLEKAIAPKGRHFAILFKDGEPSASRQAEQIATFKGSERPNDYLHEVIITFA
jgi:hypothetical protein